jgi:hypothetical protein
VHGVGESVAFLRVDDELRRHAERFQRVPELVGLRGGAFAVAVAHQDKGGRLHVLDEGDGRAFGVHRGVIVDRCAEERDHPLVDFVLAVIA